MKQLFTLTCFIILSTHAFSQSDILVLKKRNQTIQTWMHGSVITFQFSSKQWIQGIIKKIRNDSLLIDQIVITMVPNQFGFPSVDTGHLGLIRLHVNEIYGMPKKDYAGIFTNGALLKIGSGAYIFLNVANTIIKNDKLFSPQNAGRLGIAGGAYALGTVMGLSHKEYIKTGKKYRMAIIRT